MPTVVSSRYRPLRKNRGWLGIEETSDGGSTHDAHVAPSEARRIADLGQIPPDKFLDWYDCLRFAIVFITIYEADRDKTSGTLFTRRQILSELSKLSRLKPDAQVPPVLPWLVGEMRSLEHQRLMHPKWGPRPHQINNPEDFSADNCRAMRDASVRIGKGMADSGVLRELARDLHVAVSARSETTREHYAGKRALNPIKSHIAGSVLLFWTKALDRPPKITKPLIAMTSAVYALCDIDMKVDAVKRQLHEAAKSIGE